MRGYKYSRVAYRSRSQPADVIGGLKSQSPVRYLPLFLFLLVASMGVLAVDVRYGFAWLDEFMGRISNPMIHTLDRVIEPVSSSFSTISETLSARRENEELKERVAELQRENQSLRDAADENARFRELLNLKAEAAPSAMVAQVVRYVDLPGKRMLILRAGEDQGLRVGQPVLSSSNQLLGRVVETSPSSANVRLITDPTSKVRVTLERTGAQGTLYSQSGKLYLRVERSESIEKGDRIATSHLSTAFPEGLAIGEVGEEASDLESDPMVAVEMGLMVNYRVESLVPVSKWDNFREVLCLPGPSQTLLEGEK
ncbi:MAG: rod shape-determining protein MreC [Candidatus Omnitrophica bacterium]|nr:rod shape-determining protein MreC [Candidatus Omnitrophota bacterium]